MRITIHDEATRTCLTLALWRTLCGPVEGGNWFDGIAWDAGDPRESDENLLEARDAVDECLATLSRIRRQISLVSEAEIGRTVELDTDPAELVAELRNIRDGVLEGQEQFFDATPEARERMLALYDVAVGLVARLEVTEAVA